MRLRLVQLAWTRLEATLMRSLQNAGAAIAARTEMPELAETVFTLLAIPGSRHCHRPRRFGCHWVTRQWHVPNWYDADK